MLIAVTFLTLLTIIPFSVTIIRSCVPNTQFLLNGRLCICNSTGQSNDALCHMIGRRRACQPGQIIWEDCSQCICQENGRLLCTNTECVDEVLNSSVPRNPQAFSNWCTPSKSYYVNCTLCVCPASGKMSEARCAKDSSCTLKGAYTSLDSIPQTVCIPKVMYLFSCLHCLCSDEGRFLKSKCVETCNTVSVSRCAPKSFYKIECNICRCSDTGSQENNVCSKSTCTQNSNMTSLMQLRNITSTCIPNKYTKPRCFYCECNAQGTINEQACMEQECLKSDNFNYESIKNACTPGEMIPICMECFCPRSKLPIEKYCTSVCSSHSRLAVLEAILKEKLSLIDRSTIKQTMGTDSCDPNSLFLDQGRYCLCSDNGNTNFKHCTSVLEDTVPKKPSQVFVETKFLILGKIDFNISCEPSTYIEFGCNSCYCTKKGKIDPKWCTNDDCESKKLVKMTNVEGRSGKTKGLKEPGSGKMCVPGSVSKQNCNYCICGNSGLIADMTCTKNDCNSLQKLFEQDLHCDPSSYYTVDCNICYCPADGVKNVQKCTRNHCEINFLRTNSCSPGQLFSSDCNICVCPPTGEKKDKLCTNRTCIENETPWKKIFKVSESVLGNHIAHAATRNIEPCFPGEEFEIGCKVCTCPDIGLKEYATCTTTLCDLQKPDMEDFKEDRQRPNSENLEETRRKDKPKKPKKKRPVESSSSEEDPIPIRDNDNFCKTYNLTDSSELKECTPGSEYILKCKVCICPYMGELVQFCRPMPADRYCEQAFPGFNYLPMTRRHKTNETSTLNNSSLQLPPIKVKFPITINMPHNHTKYKCDKEGRIKEECFLCECKDKVIIQEHCYKSNAKNCTDVKVPICIKEENRLYT